MTSEFRMEYNGFILRSISPKDNEFLRSLRNDPRVSMYLPDTGQIGVERQTRWYEDVYRVSPNQQRFMLERDDVPLGTHNLTDINLNPPVKYGEPGVALHPDYWGKGIAVTGMRMLQHYYFNLVGLDIAVVRTHKDNARMIANFKKEGSQVHQVSEEEFRALGLEITDENHLYFVREKGKHWTLDALVEISFDPQDLDAFPK
ncbi:MAG: GNAT family N-acetyltransferase [Nanoarchaeota archaeon]|nr:GNAT family N-acetyltransferase [Nanoarchaeota archaeon]